MVLMALAMVAVLAMAALSIDVVTLYLANAEAQRSADTAALAAARVLSISGMTGDPSNSASAFTTPWQQACALATSVATAVASQNTMGGVALATSQISVTYPNNSDTANCTGTDAKFGVNPLVTVKVQRTDLPTFFARIWGRTGASVSATATAEAFNSSNSDNVGNTDTDKITPVQPRCVKPWIVPNFDPGNAGTCGAGCASFVTNPDGLITTAGIMVNNTPPGVIGRTFNLFADCKPGGGPCTTAGNGVGPPKANVGPAGTHPNLQYVPGDLPASFTAVPSCASSAFQEAVAGCDQTTLYQCGNDDQQSTVDLGQNNVANDSALGGQCLIRATGDLPGMGQDSLDTSSYPYKIKAGSANPLGVSSGSVITSSNSIVSLPIYDSTGPINGTGTSLVTIIGFLQVFINYVDATNNFVNVTVLNVAGCGNGSKPTAPTAVTGTSPVPVRLIKYP
jgi:Flp pilus assembly protein TadG